MPKKRSSENSEMLAEQLRGLQELQTILQGLTTFADMRDKEDAGDWVVVSQLSDFVRRNLKDICGNLIEMNDVGDPGDL